MADGIVFASKKSGAKIVALTYRASRYTRLNSWDRFLIPKPFGKLEFRASEPFDISDLEPEDAKKLIFTQLQNS